MPHAFLDTEESLSQIVASWNENTFQLGNTRIKVRRGYLYAEGTRALFPALVLEPLQQKWFYIEIRQKSPTRYLVKLDPITPIPRSPVVRLAVAWFAKSLQDRLGNCSLDPANLTDFFQLLALPEDQRLERFAALNHKLRRQMRAIEWRLRGKELLINLEALTPPLQWAELFGNQNPVEIEIGPGKGKFLIDTARRFPERNFLGIEWAGRYLKTLLERLPKLGVENLRLLQADARIIFRDWIMPESVEAVHVYYPDPWWKKKHKKHALFSSDFLDHLTRSLKPAGRFQFVTDVEEVYDNISQLVRQASGLSAVREKIYRPGGDPPPGRTHFEIKKWRAGSPIYEATWQKNTHSAKAD